MDAHCSGRCPKGEPWRMVSFCICLCVPRGNALVPWSLSSQTVSYCTMNAQLLALWHGREHVLPAQCCWKDHQPAAGLPGATIPRPRASPGAPRGGGSTQGGGEHPPGPRTGLGMGRALGRSHPEGTCTHVPWHPWYQQQQQLLWQGTASSPRPQGQPRCCWKPQIALFMSQT